MNRIALILALALALSACNYQEQESSLQEARFVLIHQGNFKQELQYISVRAIENHNQLHPMLAMSQPELKATYGDRRLLQFVHLFIYETTEQQICLLLLNDARPPQQTANPCFSATTAAMPSSNMAIPSLHPPDPPQTE